MLFLAATSVVGINAAMAAVDLSAAATVGVEYNTNALERADGVSASRAQSDTVMRAGARFDAKMGSGPLKLQVDGSVNRSEYARYDALANTDYTVGGNLDWKAASAVDFSLQASQTRNPVPLSDIGGDQTRTRTDTQTQGTVRVRPTPRWQIAFAPGWGHSNLPQQNGSDFSLRETSGRASLSYLAAGRLIPGLAAEETRGKYSGIANATRYKQQVAQATLNYKLSGFSTFTLEAGRTERTTTLVAPATDPLALAYEGKRSAFTWTLTVQRQFTPKTNVAVSAFRDFQQYDVGINTTLGTGVRGGITWAPTPKLSALLNSSYAWLTIEDVVLAQSLNSRKDIARTHTVEIKYATTPHLSVRTYLSRYNRSSTLASAQFGQTTAGVELTAVFD